MSPNAMHAPTTGHQPLRGAVGRACNTGLEPLIRTDNPALRRDRLSWVSQNYIRDDTLSAANAILVGAQSQLELAQVWVAARSPPPMACASSYRCAPCMPAPIRSISAPAGVSPGTT